MLKTLTIALFIAIVVAGCSSEMVSQTNPKPKISDIFKAAAEAMRHQYYTVDLHIVEEQHNDALKIDAYGLGIHANRYSQPVTLWPDFGGVQGEYLEITPDAYGHGVHSDQYGRPVREHPWP